MTGVIKNGHGNNNFGNSSRETEVRKRSVPMEWTQRENKFLYFIRNFGGVMEIFF